uniref:Major sperm protein n=1 Tax=Setaria digitata TaxID=48799 RepID=A0A915PKY1_9BILA
MATAGAPPAAGGTPTPTSTSPATATTNTTTPTAGIAQAAGGAKPPVAVIALPIPPNKPNEPAFQLKIEPDKRLEFKSDKLTEEPCRIEVKLTNPTKERQTFKVRTTSNDIFRVCPPLGFCDAETSTAIKITFSSKTVPESGRHYFAFYHMKTDKSDKTARQVWTPQSKFEGVRRIMVYFLKGDGTPAPSTEVAAHTANMPQANAPTPASGAPATNATPAAGGAAAPAPGTAPAATK